MSYKVLVECKIIPFEVRKAFGVSGIDKTPERLLWRDVAARLTLDAYGITGMSRKDKSEYRELLLAIGEAQAWFRNDYDEVKLVFALANVEMESVRSAVLAFLNQREDHHGKHHAKQTR